jgi:hypothetical protein
MSAPFLRDIPVRRGLLTAQGSVAFFGDRRAAGLPVLSQALEDRDTGIWNASTNEWIGGLDVTVFHEAIRPVESESGEGAASFGQ